MIYAEIQYEQHYSKIHSELVEFLESNFSDLQHGLQGDSWIWVFKNNEKVEIDTFYSMKHQIKSSSPGRLLVQEVIDSLSSKYDLLVFEDPKLEPHE